jgi:cytoskeletal protein RodZ
MFGFGKHRDNYDQNMHIPYEVYETVHGPTARRRRWLVRLVAALIVVTLLVFGGIALQRALSNDFNSGDQTGQQAEGAGNDVPRRVDPTPTPTTETPAATPTPQPADENTNTGTVPKPE